MAIPKYLEGKYEILETLQDGGIGAVYKVRHRLLEEVRVAKVLRLPQDDPFHVRLLSEMRAATQLSHPNIARIFDCSVDDDGLVIVLESVNGITLAELLSTSESLPLALTLEIARQGLGAIGHLHERELVSRDVSPDNLMLTVDDLGRPLVKMIDPGIARDVEGDQVSAGPGGGPTSGRDNFRVQLRYAAPEAFEEQGQETADPRSSDLYSFALVVYELLTGRFPISGTSPSSLIAGHLFRPPLDFAESDPGGLVPEQIRHAVLKALSKSPSERFADAASFAAELPEPDEMSLATTRVLRILEWAEAGLITGEALDAEVSDPGLDSAPTRIMTTRPSEEPVTEAPTVILRPPLAEAESSAVGADEPTRVLRPSFGDPPPAEALEGHETRRLSREEVLALRLEASAARESSALEESTTVIRRSPASLASPPPLEEAISDLSRAAATPAQEKTLTSPTPRAVSTPSSLDLGATLDSICALRDKGRAGEAFERLNRAVREFGPQPELRELRHELTEALLEQDADDESASQMFGQMSGQGLEVAPADDVTQTVLPGNVPAPAPEASGVTAADEPPLDGSAPPTDELAPRGAPELAETTIRGLSDATFRSLEPPVSPDRDRSEPPTAHPTRNMVLVGLILVVVFAGLVFVLSRNGPGSEPVPLETEDVAAADLSPGSLALDAVPWAEIVSLENPSVEESPPISPSRFTPVILSLPPGEYRISLRYPPTGQVEERVIHIDSDARIEERVTFESLDGKAYFQRIDW